MAFYRVKWEIDVDAASPQEAARFAKDVQLLAERIVDVFVVTDVNNGGVTVVDLVDEEK